MTYFIRFGSCIMNDWFMGMISNKMLLYEKWYLLHQKTQNWLIIKKVPSTRIPVIG